MSSRAPPYARWSEILTNARKTLSENTQHAQAKEAERKAKEAELKAKLAPFPPPVPPPAPRLGLQFIAPVVPPEPPKLRGQSQHVVILDDAAFGDAAPVDQILNPPAPVSPPRAFLTKAAMAKMTVKDLTKEAALRGVVVEEDMSKAEIVEALLASR